jgi:N-glycosylase/DNA lyase
MKSTKKLLMVITLGTTIALTGCGVQKTQSTTSTTSTQTAVSEKQSNSEKKEPATMDEASQNMRNLLKDMKAQLANKEDDKVSEGGTNLEEAWKQFEDKFEEDLKDKYLDLYVKIEDPLEIIEAAAKIKPLDTNVLNTSIDKLDKELVQLQKNNATTIGLENMKVALKEMTTQLNNKEEDKAIKTSDKLEENWKTFEDVVKDNYKDLYEKVEAPLGTIQAAVKIKPLDTKVFATSIDQLDKAISEIQKSIAFSSGPQDMETALKKINKFISPLNEEKVTKYTERLEKYWSSIEDTVKEKNPALYEKVEVPMGIIQAGVKVKPIDSKVLANATDSLEKILTEVQNLK